MARKRRGRPVHGWLILDKPAGLSSAQAVAKAKWALQARKTGHAGTLDPDATGVLAIAFGEATKTIPYIMESKKAYRFTLRWGSSTETDDAAGRTLETRDARPTTACILAALPDFVGDILQTPPQVSAIKIDGMRAYTRARTGETFEIASRPLRVESLELIAQPDADTAEFELICGKGGYVRSIGRDLGRQLGCLAHVTSLRRLWSGPFRVENALDWETLVRQAGSTDLDSLLLPVETALRDLPHFDCPESNLGLLCNGNPVSTGPGNVFDEGLTVWSRAGDRPMAIGKISGGLFRPTRILVYD